MNKFNKSSIWGKVIKGDYCIGCGACASVKDSPLFIELKNNGMYQANLKPLNDLSSQDTAIDKVCPFSDSSLNEDQISQKLFAEKCQYDSKIGYYLQTFAGYVTEGEFRNKGSSGGIGTWVLSRLLEKNLVDYVIHIHSQSPTENDPRLFK